MGGHARCNRLSSLLVQTWNRRTRVEGELAPAAKIGLDSAGALVIQDYGATVVWLQGIIRAR